MDEKIGFSEAYIFYKNYLTDDERRKIPIEFVKKMEEEADINCVKNFNHLDDINSNNISRDGAKKIAFLTLLIN